jgi:hypothetical protein
LQMQGQGADESHYYYGHLITLYHLFYLGIR